MVNVNLTVRRGVFILDAGVEGNIRWQGKPSADNVTIALRELTGNGNATGPDWGACRPLMAPPVGSR